MTQYNFLNVKMSNLQLNKLKSGIKNGTKVTLKISSNVVGDSNDENNFSRKLLLIEEMNGIRKIVTSLEKSGFLIKGISEAIKNETKEQKEGFLGMLLGTLGASLLGNLLTGKGTIRAEGGTIRAGENV